jgi:hypothetical protein
MNFGSLYYFLGIKLIEKQLKIAAQYRAESGLGLQSANMAACHVRRLKRCWASARRPCPDAAHARDYAVARSPTARWWLASDKVLPESS